MVELKKTSIIRSKRVRPCPFGLPIPEACANAGKSVERMVPIEDDIATEKANRLIYVYYKDCENCPFADKIIETKQSVDCDFGDTGQGQKSPSFQGSPLYPQTFSGIGLSGLYAHPLGYYADNNNSRNLFFGLFSLLGHANVEDMIKLADEYDNNGDRDRSDILDALLEKLSNIKNNHPETFEKISKYLSEIKHKDEQNKVDNNLLIELIESKLI
jgi:hypothetical protein